jgi:hypothetical protein
VNLCENTRSWCSHVQPATTRHYNTHTYTLICPNVICLNNDHLSYAASLFLTLYSTFQSNPITCKTICPERSPLLHSQLFLVHWVSTSKYMYRFFSSLSHNILHISSQSFSVFLKPISFQWQLVLRSGLAMLMAFMTTLAPMTNK